jgi:hypothetical protein
VSDVAHGEAIGLRALVYLWGKIESTVQWDSETIRDTG